MTTGVCLMRMNKRNGEEMSVRMGLVYMGVWISERVGGEVLHVAMHACMHYMHIGCERP